MANEEHLARLRTWIAERQVREGIRHTSQRVMARLRSTPWRELARRYQQLLMGLGALLLLLVTWKLPQWYAASWEKLTDPKDIARLESDTRSTMVQAVGGIALLAGLLFTWRNLRMTEQNSRQTLELSRKGQINDRFIKAIEQLGAADQGGSKKLEVRLGGIYALEQIGRDSPEDHHWPIMEILTAYVREHASWKEEEQPSQEEISPRETQPAQSNQSLPKLAPDIQAILTVLGRRTLTYGKGEDQPLNLSKTDLRGAHLDGAHLEGALLVGAHLEGAGLHDAHLEGALLVGAHLEGAMLWDARLDEAWLMDTRLKGAHLVTGKQLSTVRTLHQAELDPPLLEQIEQQDPHLLRERP